MPNKNYSTGLLAVARSVLRDELIREIPADKKYQALMVSSAMAISARELSLGSIDAVSDEFVQSLALLIGQGEPAKDTVRSLILKIRAAAYGAGQRDTMQLHKLLVNETKRKLEISNPGYLDQIRDV